MSACACEWCWSPAAYSDLVSMERRDRVGDIVVERVCASCAKRRSPHLAFAVRRCRICQEPEQCFAFRNRYAIQQRAFAALLDRHGVAWTTVACHTGGTHPEESRVSVDHASLRRFLTALPAPNL